MKKFDLLFATFFSWNVAIAAAGAFSEAPVTWRLESYAANILVLWHTPLRYTHLRRRLTQLEKIVYIQ